MSGTIDLDIEELPEDGSIKGEDVVNPLSFVSEDFISRAYFSAGCSMPDNIIEFQHSFGYDCKKYFNLCVADENTIIYASGNFITFFNVNTKETHYRRSAGGGGIGHITKNPTLPHLAVAETGNNPLIIIYEWPSMKIEQVLKNGALKAYTHVKYSPDGTLLCSQGGGPDFMLTIWDWMKAEIIVCNKASKNHVANVMFSSYTPSQLASCGTDHIAFWKMDTTYTGLKLLNEFGRFGKTETSDIIGLLPMNDDKVISGCNWGNFLVWDQGLIKLEVRRKNKRPCHEAPITQFIYDNGELTTVGLDGLIKVWYFEVIDQANPPDNARFIDLEPMYEFRVGVPNNPAQLMCVVRQKPDDKYWFAQDGSGGIWKLHLDLSRRAQDPEQILFCHAGPVVDMAVSPRGCYLATLGKDGRVHVYDYVRKVLLIRKQFAAAGSCILWLPLQVESSGSTLVAGFQDGVIRVIAVAIKDADTLDKDGEFTSVTQVTKPHSKPVSTLSINPEGNVIISGSEDATVFIHCVTHADGCINLTPSGFIRVPNAVTFLQWKPGKPKTLLVCCQSGELVEIEIPNGVPPNVSISYEFDNITLKSIKFQSICAQVRRETKLKKERSVWSEEMLVSTLDKIEPSPVLYATYTDSGTVLMSVGGCDAGYIHEYDIDKNIAVRRTAIESAENVEIHSHVYSQDKQYLIWGMSNGKIRVTRVNSNNPHDIKDYCSLAMHANYNGIIRRLCFSADQQYLFSCGDDGNIFSFRFNPALRDRKEEFTSALLPGTARASVEDILNKDSCSVEEMKIKVDFERRMKERNDRVNKVKMALESLKKSFSILSARNEMLPASQRFSPEQWEIDPRVTEDMRIAQQLETKLSERNVAFTKEKSNLGFKKIKDYYINVLDSVVTTVRAISNDESVSSFRQRKLGDDFYTAKYAVQIRIEQAEKRDLKWEKIEHQEHERKLSMQPSVMIEAPVIPVESFLIGLDKNSPEYKANVRLHLVLERYLKRKKKHELRTEEWSQRIRTKPDPDKNHPEDLDAIERAKQTIGDYKLKSTDKYCIPKCLQVTAAKKYGQLLETRETIFKMKREFNEKVLALRDKKIILMEHIKAQHNKLRIVHQQISTSVIKMAPPIPTIHQETECPETLYQVTEKAVAMEISGSTNYDLETKTEDNQLAEEYEALLQEVSLSTDDVYKTANHSKTTEKNTEHTLWENELKTLHTSEMLFWQDQICDNINYAIKQFDDKVQCLADLRVQVEVNTKFLELFLLQLNQELVIVRSFEEREDTLLNEEYKCLQERHEMRCKIHELNMQIHKKNKKVHQLNETITNLKITHDNAIRESRFARHLKRIYKKAYRPSKPSHQDNDSCDASTSSSDDSLSFNGSDTESTESQELITTRRESVRPDGCDEEIFKLTFALRSQRHCEEANIVCEIKQVDVLKKDLEICQKKCVILENALSASQLEMDKFQKEKQKLLNEIDVLVVLKAKQINLLVDSKECTQLTKTLLFSKSTKQKLSARISELNNESNQQKEKHKLNRLHLHHLKVECSQMDEIIKNLIQEIATCKMRKFGDEVHIEDLEEALLRRMIVEMQLSTGSFRKEREEKLNELKDVLRNKYKQLCALIKENTFKTGTQVVLQKDSNKLLVSLHQQEENLKNKKPSSNIGNLQKKNIRSLKTLKRQNIEKIEILQKEIQILSSKNTRRPLLPTARPPNAFALDPSQDLKLLPPKSRDDLIAFLSSEDIECMTDLDDIMTEDSDEEISDSSDMDSVGSSTYGQGINCDLAEGLLRERLLEIERRERLKEEIEGDGNGHNEEKSHETEQTPDGTDVEICKEDDINDDEASYLQGSSKDVGDVVMAVDQEDEINDDEAGYLQGSSKDVGDVVMAVDQEDEINDDEASYLQGSSKDVGDVVMAVDQEDEINDDEASYLQGSSKDVGDVVMVVDQEDEIVENVDSSESFEQKVEKTVKFEK